MNHETPNPQTPENSPSSVDTEAVATSSAGAEAEFANDEVETEDGAAKANAANLAKADPETLEQFIAYAYSRKGRSLKLKAAMEKQVARNLHLDEGANLQLSLLAQADLLLAVPRQLLLVSQEIEGSTAFKSALISWVSDLMLAHTCFRDPPVQSLLTDLPDKGLMTEAISCVRDFIPVGAEEAEKLKSNDLQTLRNNAVQLLVTWLTVNRGTDASTLSSVLFQAVWSPAAKAVSDASDRLRALTEVTQSVGVGVACEGFRQQALDAVRLQEQARHEANQLRVQSAEAQSCLAASEAQRDALSKELQALRETAAAEIESLRSLHAVEKTHLHNDLEQLRGRLFRRLVDSVEVLEVGLSALRKESPRVPVMIQRAEYVVDNLRHEIEALRGG